MAIDAEDKIIEVVMADVESSKMVMQARRQERVLDV